jgi:hypothetical protein
MDIRIYIRDTGEISRADAVAYAATGTLPEAAYLAQMPERAAAWWEGASPAEREKARRGLGPVRVADFTDGRPTSGGEVTLYPAERRPGWNEVSPASISTRGTWRTVEATVAFAAALETATGIAREAAALAARQIPGTASPAAGAIAASGPAADLVEQAAQALWVAEQGAWASGPGDGTPWGTSREQDSRPEYTRRAAAVIAALAPVLSPAGPRTPAPQAQRALAPAAGQARRDAAAHPGEAARHAASKALQLGPAARSGRAVTIEAPGGTRQAFGVAGDDTLTVLVDGQPVLGVDKDGPGCWDGDQWRRLRHRPPALAPEPGELQCPRAVAGPGTTPDPAPANPAPSGSPPPASRPRPSPALQPRYGTFGHSAPARRERPA